MKEYLLLTIKRFSKRGVWWVLVCTLLLLVLKMTVFPFISYATVLTPIWGSLLMVPLSAVLTYKSQNEVGTLYEQLIQRLKLCEIKFVEKDLKDAKAVTFIKDNFQVIVTVNDLVSIYVSRKAKAYEESVKRLNEMPGQVRKYVLKGTNLVQKYVFFTDSGEEVYREIGENVRVAKKVFESLKEEK